MAMGCPVAVTPELEIAPLVEAAGAGIVTGGSPDELAAAILELLGDPQRRREMGVCGVRATRARLSWNAVAAQVEELYRRCRKRNAQSAAVEPA